MAVVFKADTHSYLSLNEADDIKWRSVTSFIGQFKQKFDPVTQSIKSSKNKKSKWYGMDPKVIQDIWANETNRAIELGNWYHGQRESDLMGINTIERNGIAVPIIKPIYMDGLKHAPDQALTEGIYPEHFVYLKSHGICGQSDRVEVVGGYVDIIDYKTNKEIKKEGYRNWEGITQKMLPPVGHVDDCNLNHYALQLSMYMYIILRHNPTLKPGKLIVHHIQFMEHPEKDKYGNPVFVKDYDSNPIVRNIIPYEVPYMKNEVKDLLKTIII